LGLIESSIIVSASWTFFFILLPKWAYGVCAVIAKVT